MKTYRTLKSLRNAIAIAMGIHYMDSNNNLATATEYVDLIDTYINMRYKHIWEGYIFPELTVWDEAVTLSADERYLWLPKDVGIILAIEHRDNSLICEPKSIDDIMHTNKSYYTGNTNSDPKFWTLIGKPGIKQYLSIADTLTVVSSSTADSGSPYIITINGKDDTTDAWISEDVTLNATTEVTTTTTFKANTNINISKGVNSNGIITIKDTTTSSTLATLETYEEKSEYLRIRFNSSPSTDKTLYIHYQRKFRPLINDNDPLLIDIGEIIFLAVQADIWNSKRQIQRAIFKEQAYEHKLKEYFGRNKHIKPVSQGNNFINVGRMT